MLPRKTTITRLGGVAMLVLLGVWLYVTTTIDDANTVPNDIRHLMEKRDERDPSSHPLPITPPNAMPLSNISVKPAGLEGGKSSAEGKISGEHNHNLTLEHLKDNMTLAKVNMSGIQAMIADMNKTDTRLSLNVPNPHPFRYLINENQICKDKDLFLIAYIHTAPDHYKRRMVIRQTWGNPKYYPDVKIRVVFVMGHHPAKPQVQEALLFENEQYHDIVQEDFVDAYKNLTYKGVAALKWISNSCSHAKFVLKSDDDIFVNMFTLLRHLSSLHGLEVNNKGLLMCLVWSRMKVMREGKWKVSEDEFKDQYYPTYCSGSAFTMSMDVAVALHNISYQVPFFWVDDFYITGLLPLKLGTVKHKQFMSTYVLDGRKLEDKFTGSQWFTYIFSHVHSLDKIQSVWDRLVRLARGEVHAPVKYALPGQLPDEKKIWEAEKKKEEEKKKKKEAEKAKLKEKEQKDKKVKEQAAKNIAKKH